MAKEEWQLCADWLVNCQLLAPDHRVIWPNAQVFDLAQVLRDGVLICHLLNRLRPGAIDPKDFSQRPQMSQFLCLKNIRVFLQTCRSMFGMKESELFDPYDLFDVKDFGKVIQTLSKLSNTPVATSSGISGFSHQNAAPGRNKDYDTLPDLAIGFLLGDQSHDEEIYQRLPDIASEIPDDDIYDAVCTDDNDIYEDLCALRQQMEGQGLVQETKSKRELCLKELVETEKNYKEALEMMIVHFIRPLKSKLSQADTDIIFFGIEQLGKIHVGFHSDLMKASSSRDSALNTSNITIADCFIKWKEKFLIYGEFCSNLPKAQDQVDKICQKDPVIMETITNCQITANKGKFRLRDLLSVPMQRVLKYHLLLKELIKQTDKDHPERRCLERALDEMQDLSLYVNEVKRDNEALQLINEIQNSIVDLKMPQKVHLKDYGRLLKDGELKVRAHTENKHRNRYVFLFDKVLLMCKSRGETYNFKDALVLSQYRVDSNLPTRGKNEKGAFNFLLVEQNNEKVFTLGAKTEETRRKWIDAIHMAQENTCPPDAQGGNHNFLMDSFEEPTICDVCRKLLRGVFYQGYRCQNTQMVVHKECISKAKDVNGPPVIPVKTMPNTPPIQPPRSRPVLAKVKAEYAYQGMPVPEMGAPLPFSVNDVFDLLAEDDQNWWEGRKDGKEGFFPKTYVKKHRSIQSRVPSYETASSPSPSPMRTPLSPLLSNGGSATNSNCSMHPDMSKELWFVGRMERSTAQQWLEPLLAGTFLIRESMNADRAGQYALSIKFGSNVRHIKVNQLGADKLYFLAECKKFRSIPELVQFYQQNTLEDSFPELQTTLTLPYKDALRTGASLGMCTAQYDYAANQPNQLSLKVGDRIVILSRAGDFRGWWKGSLHGRTGYFPRTYVIEDDEGSP